MSADAPDRNGPSLRTATMVVVAVAVAALLLLGGRWGLQTLSAEPAAPTSVRTMSGAATPCDCGTINQTTRATPSTEPASGLPVVGLSSLPRQAREAVKRIDEGGPYPYDRDGAVFANREQRLPKKARGYYREYTVLTPGSADRGARRIITGDGSRELYWTNDHYETFARVTR